MKLSRKAVRGATVAVCAALLAITGTTSASARPDLPNVRYGDTGMSVKCVQDALNNWNGDYFRMTSALKVDGIFGDDTLRQVKLFQKDFGVKQDGIVGKVTGTFMYNTYLNPRGNYECINFIPTPV